MKIPEFTSAMVRGAFACSVVARSIVAGTVTMATVALPATASTEAHVHSVATLSIIQDNKNLLMELDSPLANLTGFEYKPRNMAERAQLNRAVIKLKDAKRQFEFSGWDCQAQEVNIIRPWPDEPMNEPQDHEAEHRHGNAHSHDKKAHSHDEKHGNEHQEAHVHNNEHSHHEKQAHKMHQHGDEHHQPAENHHDDHNNPSSHSDIQVHYHFVCNNTGSIQGLKVLLFADFPQIEAVGVEWLTANGAGAAELTVTENQLKL